MTNLILRKKIHLGHYIPPVYKRCAFILLIGCVLLFGAVVIVGCVSIHPKPRAVLDRSFINKDDFWILTGEQSGVNIRCRPCWRQEENLLFFDADFPSVGVIPVFVEVGNKHWKSVAFNGQSIALRSKLWELHPIPIELIRRPLFRKYQIRSYSQASLEEFFTAFRQILLAERHLEKGTSCWGVVFFTSQTPLNNDVQSIALVMKGMYLDNQKTSLVITLHQTHLAAAQ